MEEIQNTRKLLLRRIAVVTAAMVAVVSGVGLAPAGADELSAEAGGRVGVEGTFEARSGDLTVHEVVGVVAKAEQVVFVGHSGGSHG